MFFTVQATELVSVYHTILTSWFSAMLEPTKKPLSFLAASFCKFSGYFLLVSRLLIEGSHRIRVLFNTCIKPAQNRPITATGAEALGG
jgi:hypothetical protein